MPFCLGLCSSTLRYAKSNYAYCCNRAILYLCLVLWSFVLYYAFLLNYGKVIYAYVISCMALSVQNLDDWA